MGQPSSQTKSKAETDDKARTIDQRTVAAGTSPRRLIAAGMVGVLLLGTLFMTGTFTAVSYIDSSSVQSEVERAAVAVAVTADPAKLSAEYGFRNAHFVAPARLTPGEVSVPVPGRAEVLAWTPHRFATEAFSAVAPVRLLIGALIIATIIFIMLRLNALARDLEDRRRLAHETAIRDPLTGLRNRLTFDHELREVIASPQRGPGLALLYLDLDSFKEVNDTRGHLAGDQLLRQVAERLTKTAGSQDTVARLGGDEFAVIRRGGSEPDELANVATAIRIALSAPYILNDGLVTIGVSIGIARVPADAEDAESLVRAADSALYRAKADGGNRYTFADAAAPQKHDRRRAA